MITELFPRLKFVDEVGRYHQLIKIREELSEVEMAYLTDPIDKVAEETADVITACMTLLYSIEKDYGISPLTVIQLVNDKNRERGYLRRSLCENQPCGSTSDVECSASGTPLG